MFDICRNFTPKRNAWQTNMVQTRFQSWHFVFLAFDMPNRFKDNRRYSHILNRIFDLVMKFTLEENTYCLSYTVNTIPFKALALVMTHGVGIFHLQHQMTKYIHSISNQYMLYLNCCIYGSFTWNNQDPSSFLIIFLCMQLKHSDK